VSGAVIPFRTSGRGSNAPEKGGRVGLHPAADQWETLRKAAPVLEKLAHL
jgi:hypothetical protein